MTSSGQTSITRLIELSRENRDAVSKLEKFRRYITVMFTDIGGSTAYYDRFGDVAGLIMVHECNNALVKIVQQHGGRVYKTIGDSIMASFESCMESVQAAIEMQQQLAKINSTKPEDHKIQIRIGLHYGTGIVKSNDIFGDVVNVASRVESFARPEQIAISENLEEQVRDCNFALVPLGRFRLKGKERDCGLFEAVWAQDFTPQPAIAHTIVCGSTISVSACLKLQHLAADGGVQVEYELKDRLTIGRTQGDRTFPADASMSPINAAVSIENGQVFVENLSAEKRVFVRLISAYTLGERDVIMMGKQLFEYREVADAMSLGTTIGISLANLGAMLKTSVAEFVHMSSGKSTGSYPLDEDEITFGRTNGKYIFPEDRVLSRTHAKVYYRGENFFLEDMGSRNGTFIRVKEKTPIPIGSSILIGQQLLRLSE